eukprot:gene19068-38260_t
MLEDVMTELGVEAKKDFRLAAQVDLGPDAKFSGWLRAGELKVGFEHIAPGVIEMRPRPQGVAVVAQDGRRAGTKTRTRGKRRSASWGSTRGHRTIDDAITLTEEETTGDPAMTRDLNYRLGIDGKDASKSLRDTGSEAKKLSKELGEAKVSGDTVAKAIRQVADTASADLKKAQSAAKALGTALGPELVAELEQAGGSMLGLTPDMKRLAGSYEEVEANAEALADAIRHANAVQKEMGSASLNSAGSLDNLTRSGDQTRSVMANLTGNASQDLAQLAGVSGTAGVAIGQLAEYAADGNINMGNLTKLAGPMVALGVAGWGVSEVIGNIREKAALAKEQTELWLDVQRQLNAALAGDDVDLG